MASVLRLALVTATLQRNEAVSLHRSLSVAGEDSTESISHRRLFEKDTLKDMMASMTIDTAYSTFMHMNHSHVDASVLALIQARLGKQSTQGGASSAPTGYAAVDSARDMLNQMIDEATMKKELEGIDCKESDISMFAALKQIEGQISHDNAEAAAARSESLRAAGVIQILKDYKLPQNREELRMHNRRCEMEIANLKSQIAIVAADIEVMKKIIDMVCADDVRTTTTPPFFLQLDEDDNSGSMSTSLVKCVSCLTGRQAAWVKNNRMHTLLAGVRSEVAKEYIQQHLLDEFSEGERRMPTATSVVLLQREEIAREMRSTPQTDPFNLGTDVKIAIINREKCNELAGGANASLYRGCQDETLTGRKCQNWNLQTPHTHKYKPSVYNSTGIGNHNFCRNPDNKKTIWCYTTSARKEWEFCQPKLVLDFPNGITKRTCVEADMCKLNKADCGNLKDRFLRIMAGIVDTHSALSDDLAELEHDCKETREDYERVISGLEASLAKEQELLAAATETLISSMQSASDGNSKHKEQSTEYHKKMTECCDARNAYNAEICALTKIRGELYKIEGKKILLIDCEVGDWVDEECTVSCGGGTQARTRSVIMHPVNGAKCPPLKMQRSCNAEGCPIDCKVDDWGGWSACTAQCGGGVRTRVRTKTREPENSGDTCPDMSDTQECNGALCDPDCDLGDWGAWGLCSKVCDSGVSERIKKIISPARGRGTCPPAASEDRLALKDCNQFPCDEMLKPGKTVLECTSMVDVIILLDGSGSLRRYGWKESKAVAEALIKSLKAGPNNVNVAVLLFSGPRNWPDLIACTGGGDDTPSDEKCGMKWVSELTDDVPQVARNIEGMKWPRGSTLTSMALAKADAELINGRQDATSVVITITDGKPLSPLKTGKAAANLKKKAKLMFVPVGRGVKSSIKQMEQWASQPSSDNVIEVDTFATLNTPNTMNRIISGFCESVQ